MTTARPIERWAFAVVLSLSVLTTPPSVVRGDNERSATGGDLDAPAQGTLPAAPRVRPQNAR